MSTERKAREFWIINKDMGDDPHFVPGTYLATMVFPEKFKHRLNEFTHTREVLPDSPDERDVEIERLKKDKNHWLAMYRGAVEDRNIWMVKKHNESQAEITRLRSALDVAMAGIVEHERLTTTRWPSLIETLARIDAILGGEKPKPDLAPGIDRFSLVPIIREWKHAWMKQEQRYSTVAYGIDANMVHDLAIRISNVVEGVKR